MFGFLKKRLWRDMEHCIVLIQLATFNKFYRELVPQFGDEGKPLAAAVSNRLFAMRRSPSHENISAPRIEDLAQNFIKLQHGGRLFLGILLSLRMMAAIATDKQDAESLQRIRNTIQWMASIVSLPPDAPNPQIMKQMASALSHEYPALKDDEV